MQSLITIVIPTYEREKVLVDSIRYLLGLALPADELLVIDQTPRHDPGTESTLSKWDREGSIGWIRHQQPSTIEAMNRGLSEAKGDIVLFLDDDIIPEESLISAHLRAYEQNPGAWAVVGRVIQPEGQKKATYRSGQGLKKDLDFDFSGEEPAVVTNIMAGNLSVWREKALLIGGFDEAFVPPVSFRFETDFAKRIVSAGGEILFEPAACIKHLRAARGGTRIHGSHLVSASPTHGVGDYYYALKHGKGWDRFRYILRRPFREVCTRFHLRHPWWIPVKFVGELRAIVLAFHLYSNHRKTAEGSIMPLGNRDQNLFHSCGVAELRRPHSDSQVSASIPNGGASSARPHSERSTMLSVTLIHTHAPDRKHGSMVQYGNMVRQALAMDPSWNVHEINLAPTEAALSKWPARIQTPIRYLCIAWNARRLIHERNTLLHLLDGSHAYLLSACRNLRVPLVITVHDLIPLLTVHGGLDGKKPGPLGTLLIRWAARNLRRANQLLTVSKNTENDVIRLTDCLHERVQSVYSPVSVKIEVPEDQILQPSNSYLLHVAGNNTFYKNRIGVLSVFARVREFEDVGLKMVGAPPDTALREQVQSMGLTDRVEFISNVNENELARLYRSAAVFLFPSLYEGFGWPPLEAMQYGCPVVASNAGSLEEILGDAALLGAPGDIDTLAEHVVRILRDADMRKALIQAGYARVGGYTLAKFAAGLRQVYRAAGMYGK